MAENKISVWVIVQVDYRVGVTKKIIQYQMVEKLYFCF